MLQGSLRVGMSASLLAAWAVGCQHADCRRCPTPPVPPPPVMSFPVPSAGPAPVAATALPPQPLPQAGGIGRVEFRSYEPPLSEPAPAWRPSTEGGIRLGAPEVTEGRTPERAAAPPKAPAQTTPPAKPSVTEETPPPPALPVGISQFATAKEQVTNGLKPQLDGLDWLKENGYRAVLHLRQPGEDDVADRRQVEKRGLFYLSLEVPPQALTKASVEEFNRIVSDPASQPLFVYDKDGALAGGLWYLYFRTVDKLTDAEARTRAGRLGLKDTQNGDQKLMWLAVQKYLSEMGK